MNATMQNLKCKKNKGFTLIELSIVIAIIGIVAAIAIPNLMNAWDKARQKRSMADLRTWGVALSSYYIDRHFYPHGPDGFITPNFYAYICINETKDLLPPPYRDGWEGNFYYWSGGTSVITAQGYTIASLGKGHALDSTIIQNYRCFQCDIRLRNGMFFLKPEGPQIDSNSLDCDPSRCQ